MDNKFATEIERRMKSDAFLLKGIIKTRMDNFLEKEATRQVKKIVCLEQECRGQLSHKEKLLDFNCGTLFFEFTFRRFGRFLVNTF